MLPEDKYMLWLSLVNGIGNKKLYCMIDYFKTAKNIWEASKNDMYYVPELTEDYISMIIKSKDEKLLETQVNNLEKKGIHYFSFNNEMYPSALKEISDFPVGIYVVGELPDDNLLKISIVGTRRCSEYGSLCSYKFGKELAENNIVVVSGMALGLDTMAHKGALDGGGKTIAVFGCGIDVCYPSSNRELMEKIKQNGCIISEYPLGTRPLGSNFPVRNRIISGLSAAAIVIEAAERSGSLITAYHALEQGRDVFALPGNITSKLSKGTNNLIKEGAFPITETKDILDYYNISENVKDDEIMKKIQELAPEEKLVYHCISSEPISVDEIILKTNSQIQTVQYILTMLELKGYIQRLPGQKYICSL